MATVSLGRVGFVNKGTYNGATPYKINDVVKDNTGTYACIQANTGQATSDTLYWQEWVNDDAVHKTGNETIAGIKTFSSSPIAPTPTAGTQMANKDYVDNKPSGFKNYIINGDFSVWQRGTSFTGSNQFYADRWKQETNTNDGYSVLKVILNSADLQATGQTTSLKVSVTAGTVGFLNDLRTRIENPSKLIGKTVTLSYWVKSDQENVTINNVIAITIINSVITTQDSIGTIVIGTTWQKIVKTFIVSSTENVSNATVNDVLDIVLSSPVGVTATMYITGVQLEEGSVATPFEQRPYGLELSLCQRYYEVNSYGIYFTGYFGGAATGINLSYPFKVRKRIPPTVTKVDHVVSNISVNNIAAQSSDSCYIYLTNTVIGNVVLNSTYTAVAEL